MPWTEDQIPHLTDQEIEQRARETWEAKPEKYRRLYDEERWVSSFAECWKVVVAGMRAELDG